MIYFVTNQPELFSVPDYTVISIEKSLEMLHEWQMFQFDTETSGRDAHINKVLLMQFGNMEEENQIVVDVTTISPLIYKEYIESHYMVGQNLKFDLQFLFSCGIVVTKCYDTMIVEQLLYLGYPFFLVGASTDIINEYCEFAYNYEGYDKLEPKVKKALLYENVPKAAEFIYNHSGASLKAIAYRYRGIDLDKTVRGEIIWRGIDTAVIKYAAGDVMHLAGIMKLQLAECKRRGCLVGAKLECDFVPVISYLEWCGIKLDEEKWRKKMTYDESIMEVFHKSLNDFVVSSATGKDSFIAYISLSDKEEDDIEDERKKFKNEERAEEFDFTSENGAKFEAYRCKIKTRLPSKYVKIDTQGDLFTGFNLEPQCIVNWASSQQVVPILKTLGFNTTIINKKTDEESDSALEKVLAKQKGVNDAFLKVYLDYKEADKVCSTYGQTYINAINPLTGRIHTNFKQIGASSGRMACGSQEINVDLAKLKGLPLKVSGKNKKLKCAYPQIQNLPADHKTRSCFISEKDNYFCSCDYSALESRLGADIYDEKSMIEEFVHGSGDMHSLVAKKCFPKELEGIEIKDIKKLRPDLRKKAKAPEFAKQFGGGASSIRDSLGTTMENAEEIALAYDLGFPGVTSFGKKALAFVRKNGYVIINPRTGHRIYWADHSYWLIEQRKFDEKFWSEYRKLKAELGEREFNKTWMKRRVSLHFKAVSKWGRMGLNSPTQGSGIIILKYAMTNFLRWIIENGLFGIVKIVNLVHDEACIEYPKTMPEIKDKLKEFMEEAASVFCTKLPIPAEAEVGEYWIH